MAWYEARVQLCKAHWHITVQLQSQYNFILLDLFKVKQLAFCSVSLTGISPIHSATSTQCVRWRRRWYSNIYADHSIIVNHMKCMALCLNQSVARTHSLTVCMNWIFSLLPRRTAVIFLIVAQSNGNNLHTQYEDASFRMSKKERTSSISAPLKVLILRKIRPYTIIEFLTST